MKLPTLLGSLLLSASSAIADDFLYLRCKLSVDMVITNPATSETVEDRTMEDISTLKINFAKKTILDSRSEGTLDIAIQDKILTIPQRIDDKKLKLIDIGKIKLTPPYLMSGKGTAIYKSKNQTSTYSYEGLCKEVDASVFEKALKESES
ncbi:hypothetical protein [Synechococcus sp. UW179A]|uniref:hypothetical protein n=1 Tax=Synechococcus sp. UW179A TaxID=2575510 RepID=UPI000E0FDDE6|nr:hypothetical protein [Synechococcus sp. UW179A]